MEKIAVIWGMHRNDPMYSTHHVFWEETLRRRPGFVVERLTWKEVDYIPNGFDLHLFIDFHTSLFRLPPDRLRPRALYWWDSFHHTFAYPAQVSEHFDRAYFAEKLTADSLKNAGFDNARWLPPAYYPELYRPLPGVGKVHDYAFLGNEDNVVVRERQTRHGFLDRLRYTSGIHGYIGTGIFGDLVNQIYNESKILFDWSIFYNLGTRFFETIGSGGFLLMNRLKHPNGMDLLAKEGEHFACYDGSFDDFERQLRKYLKDIAARERIARQGHEHFLKHHTYSNRLDQILSDFNLL
jgi:hypothetical protein